MSELTIYENAKHWVAQYESVDEVKDFMDKAAAVEEYARRANDTEMENKAAMARLRAERRCGQLLKEMDKAKGELKKGDKSPPPPNAGTGEKPKTLADMGLTSQQSSTYQKLADVPEEKMEDLAKHSGDYRPSARNIVQMANPKPKEAVKQIDEDALYVWGRFRDFNNEYFNQDLGFLIEQMTEPMKEDMREFIPKFKQWLENYDDTIKPS